MNEKTPSTPANRRRPWGRRRSDWIIPLLLLIALTGAFAWAWNNYQAKTDVAEINRSLEVQTQLRERQIRNYEKQLEKRP
jgi:hypothetical protein